LVEFKKSLEIINPSVSQSPEQINLF